jgi:hypothetical protein
LNAACQFSWGQYELPRRHKVETFFDQQRVAQPSHPFACAFGGRGHAAGLVSASKAGLSMPLIHGQNISAQDIEHEVSRWDAVLFARLGNAVAWASTWEDTPTTPAFTERVNVADNGIDAQWIGTIALGDAGHPSLLRDGTNVFQYKKREVTEQSRAAIVTGLIAELRGAAADVEQRTGHHLSSYVLFTNIDLTIEQHERLRTAIAEGITDGHVTVAVIGAANLAAMLNGLPHLRSAFFATGAFRTWGESWDAHERAVIFPHAPLTGRDQLLTTLRAWLNDPDVRVIALSGTHMMGKSRLALEATRVRDVNVVEALDRASLSIDQLRRLEIPGREVIVIVNDADASQTQQLTEAALVRSGLKLMFCLPTMEAMPAPSFGLDSRIHATSLHGLTEPQSRELLRAIRKDLDFALESWVLDNADGVPGVILAAALLGPELRRDGESFLEQVARGFERQVIARVAEPARQALGILSLMSHVGIEREAIQELNVICASFGADVHSVLDAVEALVAAGFVRLDGSYAEVVPPPLANRLAARTIRGRPDSVRRCFVELTDAGRARFLRRLLLLRGDEAQRFWEDLLGDQGPFATLDGLIENSQLFRFAAAANGERAAPTLLRLLQGSSVEQRRTIVDDARRDLVRAVEEMLFREATSETALRSLILLAEAENETWSNNATGVAKEAFFPLHSQMPLPLPRRLNLLVEMMRLSERISLIAVDAMADALELSTAITTRTTSGATPLGQRPEMTWGDVFRYQEGCIDLLMNAALRDDRVSIRSTAARRVPRALMNLVLRGQVRRSLPHLSTIVDAVIAETDTFNVSDLADAMMWGRHALRGDNNDAADDETTRETVCALTEMIDRLLSASFAVRLKLWAGGWLFDPENTPAPRAAADAAIAGLAREVHQTPSLLTDDLVEWLSSGAAQAGSFWFQIGRGDIDGIFRSRIRALAANDAGVNAFVTYILGWCSRDRDGGRRFFSEVAGAEIATPRAILFGALEIDPPDQGADRIVELIQTGRIDGERMLDPLRAARWLREVSEHDLVRVLRLIAGPDFARGSQIPHFIFFRAHDTPLAAGPLADLAWEYLEAHQPTNVDMADFYSDYVAARLAPLDRERGFGLLRTTILDERSGHRWNPLASRPQLSFWRELSQLDRARALATLLDASRTQGNARYTINWHLPYLIDLESDAALLSDYAARGEPEALTVCQALTGGRNGFWPLVFRLVNLYPASAQLRRDLELRVEQMGQLISGAYSEHFQRCRDDVEQALLLPGVTEPIRMWLTDFSGRLGRALDEQRRREADERINRG